MDPIPATDLKQWAYCKRIAFYHQVLPVQAKTTFKMKEAHAAQDLIEGLGMRRSLREYGLENAQRRFGVWMRDEPLGLSGKADLVLESPDSVAVVDFKLTSGEPGKNHLMQLTAYALLAETTFGRTCSLTFLYRIPDNRVFPIPITIEMRTRVQHAIVDIREMETSQILPAPTDMRQRCVECEYANYCGDIW